MKCRYSKVPSRQASLLLSRYDRTSVHDSCEFSYVVPVALTSYVISIHHSFWLDLTMAHVDPPFKSHSYFVCRYLIVLDKRSCHY